VQEVPVLRVLILFLCRLGVTSVLGGLDGLLLLGLSVTGVLDCILLAVLGSGIYQRRLHFLASLLVDFLFLRDDIGRLRLLGRYTDWLVLRRRLVDRLV
jgi:hypothetical protein